jgi:hypothetical protein
LSIVLSAPDQAGLRDARGELLSGILEFYKSRAASVDATKERKREDPSDGSESRAARAEAAKEYKREDPSDGSLWAWPEFKARHEVEFGLEATTEYWNSMHVHRESEKPRHTAVEHESRRDPADGSPWTWPEFKARYEEEYGLKAITKYWESMPLSTEVKSPASRAGAHYVRQCHRL